MKKLLLLLGLIALLVFTYVFARRNAVEPSFPVTENDSLGVYRFAATEYYSSDDKKLEVSLSYIQLGESDSFYQMRLSTNEDPYYGHIYFDRLGEQTGTFSCSTSTIPITFHVDRDDNVSIIVDNDTIAMTEYSH